MCVRSTLAFLQHTVVATIKLAVMILTHAHTIIVTTRSDAITPMLIVMTTGNALKTHAFLHLGVGTLILTVTTTACALSIVAATRLDAFMTTSVATIVMYARQTTVIQ